MIFGDINNNPDDTLLLFDVWTGVPDVDEDTYLASSDIDPDTLPTEEVL